MKQKAYHDSVLKHQIMQLQPRYPQDGKRMSLPEKLRLYQENGKHEVLWRLKPYQVELIENYGWLVEAARYTVRVKKFPKKLREKYPILNKVHQAYCQGKVARTFELSVAEKSILSEFGLPFKPVQYRIYLTSHR